MELLLPRIWCFLISLFVGMVLGRMVGEEHGWMLLGGVLCANVVRGGGVFACSFPWLTVVARRETAAELLLAKFRIDIYL
jgi:hypothetical protein